MTYLEKINELLQPKSNLEFKVLDLFAGCGGLSLGFESLGFQTVGYEMDLKATETYNTNLNGKCFAQKITSETQYNEYFDIVIGGPPCQPFSVGGHQKGIDDERNGYSYKGAKGKKDRCVMLSQVLLDTLKDYYETYKPKDWLFEGQSYDCYSTRSVQKIFQVAKEKTGILKEVSFHALRHSFATHLHEAGTDITYHSRIFGA